MSLVLTVEVFWALVAGSADSQRVEVVDTGPDGATTTILVPRMWWLRLRVFAIIIMRLSLCLEMQVVLVQPRRH